MVESSFKWGLEILRAHYREAKMNEYVSIKKENLQKTYDNSCEDVQNVLKDLFPDDLGRNKFCCRTFGDLYNARWYYEKLVFDSKVGDYYVFPDINGWTIYYCPICGAHYDGKEWTPRV